MSYEHSGSEVIEIQDALDNEDIVSVRSGSRWPEENAWTSDQIDNLISLYDSGMKLIEIARKMKRSVSSIDNELWRLSVSTDFKRRHIAYTEIDVKKLVKLYTSGKKPREIAKILGRTYDSVRSELRSLGLCK